MQINDLKHLETLKEVPEVMGGSFFSSHLLQLNFANVRQKSTAGATALAFDGDATAIALAINNSYLEQDSFLFNV